MADEAHDPFGTKVKGKVQDRLPKTSNPWPKHQPAFPTGGQVSSVVDNHGAWQGVKFDPRPLAEQK